MFCLFMVKKNMCAYVSNIMKIIRKIYKITLKTARRETFAK